MVLLLSLVLAAALPAPQVAFVRDGQLRLLNVQTGSRTVAVDRDARPPVRFSGDGSLVSAGGSVSGGTRLPTTAIAWAPEGTVAAYQTKTGAVAIWQPGISRRTILPASWGATSLAWGPGGRLALGRSACRAPCRYPQHQEVWIWRAGTLTRVAGPLKGVQRPIVTGFDPLGRVLWWSDLEGSASIAADGLPLYADRKRLAETLPYPDYVARCGNHLALAAGTDRYSTRGKRILLDGRDVSRDPTRSWVSPACGASGRLVAAAGSSREESRFGREHRSIWQLLPRRRRLTHPPAGWTDEDPTLLPDGSIVFVRTRQSSFRRDGQWFTTTRGIVELVDGGRPRRLTEIDRTEADATGAFVNFYGHYPWPDWIAVAG